MSPPNSLPARAAALAVAFLGSSCLFDPGTTAIEVDSHRLEPKSAVFGYAHYEHDGVWFVDQKYDVTWVVVTDAEDACAWFTESARCPAEGPANPTLPPRPDGRLFEVSFNSFAEDEGAAIGEGSGGLEAHFAVFESGEPVLSRAAVSGSMTSPSVDALRAWGSFDFVFEGGSAAKGSFSAERCDAMDEILRRELYDLPRCP